MPKATVRVGLPKGSPRTGTTSDAVWNMEHSDSQTQLAKDVADALREMGYDVLVKIEREITEEY